MTHYQNRCKNCGILFLWQGSGHGCNNIENNHEYCPECALAIHEALKKNTEKSGESR